ncbi:sensor histidine kinase KdpD [Streptomyces sp. G1]|uniref:sensor histidine kinase n=1 Tax=Streptomyces sp. G1 TaxID=361572 RepID=UPI002030A807|nr:HAMP domain-containing sensor histidine kinase [Streptomyces sp. G1]MCM1971870.1 HAMP domain-containing histidine kinase [Streptomyces sp. G1]
MNAPPEWEPEPPTVVVAAAHQMRGPLSSVRLRLELLQDRYLDAADPAPGREVAAILREVARLSEVLEQVLAWGAVEHAVARAETADALAVAGLRVEAWSAAARAGGTHLEIIGERAPLVQQPGTLEQTLDVLLDNALKVSPPGGTVRVSVGRDAPGEVAVDVCDEGPGMTREEIAHACEPFWRGRAGRGGRGSGLGLTIAAALLGASGGRLELGLRTGLPGLRARAVLPADAPAPTGPPQAPAPTARASPLVRTTS